LRPVVDISSALDLRAAVPSTVLIASAEHLAALLDRADMAGAEGYADTDALRALHAITSEQPDIVAIERAFAATSRGAALIHRIKADPSLAGCEIRVLAHDSPQVRLQARPATAPAPLVTPSVTPSVATPLPLDVRGTRRAPRFGVIDDIEVLVDGNPATLVDVSVLGAQVVSPSVLKPNQRVRLWLHDPLRPIRFSGSVAWAAFEIPKTGPRYRAGIEFVDASPDVMSRFIDANKK